MYTFVRNSYLIIILERLRPNQKPNGVCLRGLRCEGSRLQGKENAHVGGRRGQTTWAAAAGAAPGQRARQSLETCKRSPRLLDGL